jgi:hypothetical protein
MQKAESIYWPYLSTGQPPLELCRGLDLTGGATTSF